MKKLIYAVLIAAAAGSTASAFDMSELENAAANAKMAAAADDHGAASGIADMSFSGSLAKNPDGTVAVSAETREAARQQLVVMDSRTSPLAKEVPPPAGADRVSELKKMRGFGHNLKETLKLAGKGKWPAVLLGSMVVMGALMYPALGIGAVAVVGLYAVNLIAASAVFRWLAVRDMTNGL